MKKSGVIAFFVAMLAVLVAASAASAGGGHGKVLYQYWGQVEATGSSSVTITVQNGNHPALRSLLGQSQMQTFATDAKTVFLKWDKGKPTVVGIGDLAQHDYVLVHIRADRGASLDTIKANAGQARRRPRPDGQPADAAALPLPRDARLRRGRQGHDRRQGRQPARPAAHDRPGGAADVHDRRRHRLPPLGAPDPDRRRPEHAEAG